MAEAQAQLDSSEALAQLQAYADAHLNACQAEPAAAPPTEEQHSQPLQPPLLPQIMAALPVVAKSAPQPVAESAPQPVGESVPRPAGAESAPAAADVAAPQAEGESAASQRDGSTGGELELPAASLEQVPASFCAAAWKVHAVEGCVTLHLECTLT